MTVVLSELRKKKHLSVSALTTFLSCSRKYELGYIRSAPRDYYPASLALGSAWHSAVAAWLNETGDDAALDEQLRDDLRERLRHDDIPVLFDTPEENADTFVERTVKMFSMFRQSVPRPRKVLGTEIAFQTTIVHPATGEVLPVPVIGALDAVVIEADGLRSLWELKTGRKWAPDRVEHDAQLTLYRKAARELGFDGVRLRVHVATKTKEPQVQTLDIERSDADEAELAELFFDVHRAIKAGISYRQRGWACRSCQYASSCRP